MFLCRRHKKQERARRIFPSSAPAINLLPKAKVWPQRSEVKCSPVALWQRVTTDVFQAAGPWVIWGERGERLEGLNLSPHLPQINLEGGRSDDSSAVGLRANALIQLFTASLSLLTCIYEMQPGLNALGVVFHIQWWLCGQMDLQLSRQPSCTFGITCELVQISLTHVLFLAGISLYTQGSGAKLGVGVGWRECIFLRYQERLWRS